MSTAACMSLEKEVPSKPWYRHGWPWFLISFPLMSVLLGIMMLYLGLSANNSLVVDDYYKEGKGINLRIERDRTATLLGLQADVRRAEDGLIVDVSRSAEQAETLPGTLREQAEQVGRLFQWPESLSLRWVHATRAELDGQARLQSIGGDRYLASDAQLPQEGRYRLHLQASGESQWRLVSEASDLQSLASVPLSARGIEDVFHERMLEQERAGESNR